MYTKLKKLDNITYFFFFFTKKNTIQCSADTNSQHW